MRVHYAGESPTIDEETGCLLQPGENEVTSEAAESLLARGVVSRVRGRAAVPVEPEPQKAPRGKRNRGKGDDEPDDEDDEDDDDDYE